MNIFEMLDRQSRRRVLPFLVIGGHAVNAYGFSRFTKDVDIAIRRDQREAWLEALAQRGFSIHRDGVTFLQLNPPPDCTMPLDLMLVNEPTFANLSRDSRAVESAPAGFRVPSLDGLLALKFHVLKQKVPGRGYKDLLDVLELARCNGLELRSDRVKSLCLKFGSQEVYEQILVFNA